jgi:Trypsin-like peptidase domain
VETPWSARLHASGISRGSGVLVRNDLLITCAHVIRTQPIRESPPEPASSWATEWIATFGTTASSVVYRILGLADTKAWMPGDTDLAVLKVEPEVSSAIVKPAICRSLTFAAGPYVAVGWPGRDRPQTSVPLSLLAPSSAVSVQADLVTPTGYAIGSGMSGGGVMVSATGDVVGLLAMRETKEGVSSGQVVPLHVVAHPELNMLVRLASRTVESCVVDIAHTGARAQHFIGREDIFASVDAQLSDPSLPAGYVILLGEPGAGKTAIMAELASRRSWFHHFNRVTAGVTTPRDFLRNICAQLIVGHGLHYNDLPDQYDQNSEVLAGLLEESVAVRQQAGLGPLVVVVDALDEAQDPPPGANRLFLPATLPKSSYIVASLRLNVDARFYSSQRGRSDLVLAKDSTASSTDLRAYTEWFLADRHSAMSQRLRELSTTRAEFIDAIVKSSDGNFMYLVQVLPDIALGHLRSISRLDDLPIGLRQYYERHWREMEAQDRKRFRELQRPVIAMLATAREPVSIPKITEWVNNSGKFHAVEEDDVADVLEEWGQFIYTVPGNPPRHRLYHASFLEFLAAKANLTSFRRASLQADDQKINW